jgi:SAM-dependent methyltransferase
MNGNFQRLYTSGENDLFRKNFVQNWVLKLNPNGNLLDVGAGTRPFRDFVIKTGIEYKSHDFNSYEPNADFLGYQTFDYTNVNHDYICDITELPAAVSNYVLCTEVLEHVPDPVRALESIVKAMKPRGKGLITVPLNSLIHQSPYYFSSGLSPWWFEYHLKKNGVDNFEIYLVGDYVDYLIQEIPRIFGDKRYKDWYPGEKLKGLLKKFQNKGRKFMDKSTLESGGIGVYVEFQIKDE